jgi:hypothetical protein
MIRTHVFKKQRFTPPRFSFYDLRSSGHVENEVTPPRKTRRALENALKSYRKKLRRIPTRPAKRNQAEEETLLKQLRAMGYVEATAPF